MDALKKLFNRDLDKLMKEIEEFQNSEDLWRTVDGISNSSGNLCLHLIGNMNHFFGAIISKTGYIRKRDKEFDEKGISKEVLIAYINKVKGVVLNALDNLPEGQLKKNYPVNVFGEEMTYEFFLIHLHSHLNYHLGQINYLRRFLQKV